MNKIRILLVISLALIGGGLSLVLLYQHHISDGEAAIVSMLCGGGDDSGCGAVSRSGYAEVSGFPVAAFGAIFYLSFAFLFAVAYFSKTPLRFWVGCIGFFAIVAAMAINLLLLALQAFAIGAFCLVCISTYVVAAMILVLLFPYRRFPEETFGAAMQHPESDIVVFSSLSGIVLICALVFITNLEFSHLDVRKIQGRLAAQVLEEFNASKIVKLDLTDAPMRGSVDAPIQVVVFSDYLCPYCRQTAQLFRQYLPQWDGRVALYFKNYPMDKLCNPYGGINRTGACWGALGGYCAAEQNLFWEYNDKVFDSPPSNPSGADFMKLAYDVGIDTVAMKACLLSTGMRKKVADEIKEGHGLDIKGTPTIYVNGKKVSHLNYLVAILKSEAERLGVGPLEGLDD